MVQNNRKEILCRQIKITQLASHPSWLKRTIWGKRFPHFQSATTWLEAPYLLPWESLLLPNFLLGHREKRKLFNPFVLKRASARLPFLLQGSVDCGGAALPSAGDRHTRPGSDLALWPRIITTWLRYLDCHLTARKNFLTVKAQPQ